MGGRSAQPSSHPEQGASQASKAEGQVTRKPAPTMLETALVPTIDSTKVVNESGQNEQSGAERSVPAKGSADCERGPLVPEPGSPPAMVVLVTPVSPSERERQAKGEAQREDSPPAQEKGQDFQVRSHVRTVRRLGC